MNTYTHPPSGIDLIALLQRVIITAGLFVLLAAIITIVGVLLWQAFSPATFQQYLLPWSRQVRWQIWTIFGWPRVAKGCGLSVAERRMRSRSDGTTRTFTKWTHPRVLSISASDRLVRLTMQVRTGQTVDDLAKAVPAIRDSIRAYSARSVAASPGTIRMEFVLNDHLSTAEGATERTAVTTTATTLGRCENGTPWKLQVAERHTLTVGCSGSGKGSVFWGTACSFGPAIAEGLVQLIGIDLKYGIEISVGARLFSKVATTEADAVETLAALEKLMDQRGNAMAGGTRAHRPTKSSPLVVLLIDELAGVTAYMSDPSLRKEAAASLSRILTKGRALGIVVVAFLQDPRKEVLPMRGLFTQTIGLRLRSRDEVAMVLGDGMADVAPAHRISPDKPGTGYVIAEDGQVTKVRADFWSDEQIRSTAKQYGRASSSGGNTAQ